MTELIVTKTVICTHDASDASHRRTTDTTVINDFYTDFLKHTEHSTVPKI